MKKCTNSSSVVLKKEQRFQEIYDDWKEYGKYNDEMWNLVIDCCKNIALHIIKRNSLYSPRTLLTEERAMDAAIDVIRRMKENDIHPDCLRSYASSWVTYHLQHKASNVQQDKEYQLNAFLDDNGYKDYTEEYTESFEDELTERLTEEGY
jgi:pentatricopeptide repeat protein